MSYNKSQVKVQVLNQDYKGVQDAQVTLKSNEITVSLICLDSKGNYISQEPIPKGTYEITVEKKPFEKEVRKFFLSHSDQVEHFILMKKGTPYYYRGKVKTPFTPDDDRIALVISEKHIRAIRTKQKQSEKPSEREEVASQLAKKYKLKIEERHVNFNQSGIFICTFPEKTSKKEKLGIRESIEKEETSSTLPIIKLTEEYASLLTNEIMVKFEDYVDEKEVKKIAKQNDLRIKRKISVLGNLYHFTTGKVPTYDTLNIINKLAELDGVEFAEPNLAGTEVEDAITPTDFLFPEQWDHQLIRTTDAWQFLRNINVNRTFGNPNVILSVVDSGVDPNHPDFNGTVSDGRSKIYQSFDFANMVANNNLLASDHGTCCASASASSANNTSAVAGVNEGVAGVAGNCRVLAIRRSGTESRYADMYLWAAGFDPESDDDDFPAQISPGADVISNSIALGSSVGSPITGTMSAVFDKLTDDGRDGKGVLLFFSAANNTNDNDTAFDRPWGMYNRCFSIAASTLANDGVTEVKAGYSNFGSTTEFCAPSSNGGGVRLHNPTGGYGTLTATIRQANPFQNLTLNANANSGANALTLSAVLSIWSGVLTLNNGGNTESHFFSTVADARRNRTNQITLFSNLNNNHNNGVNVQIYAGFTPGNSLVANNLNGNVVAGGNVITLNNATGFAVGQSIIIENPGNANSESNIISAINGNQIALGGGLFNSHPDDTPIFGSTADYRNYFGGTSHATPLCAGTAALMLSANPQLTWTQVRDLMRETAVKINPGETNAVGRWQDENGNFSNSAAYNGNPFFSEFYGYGRIDTAAAVREAGWDIELVTTALDFNDVPEGDTVSRAIRFNIKSLWPANFNISAGPGLPFNALSTSSSIGSSPDSSVVREVYLWITYEGITAGDQVTMADGVSVTVQNPETEQEWVIPITANVIDRQTSAIMLCLDQSGSMDFPSGIGSFKRIDVLRFSANIMIDVLREDNGLGIVSFDHDPHDVLSFIGPVGAPPSPSNPFDQDRTDMKTAINNFNANPSGNTAIGDGIERALTRLNPVGGYDSKSVIVFTDGKETAPKYIADVSDQINNRMFAIGLGKAENINPAALNEVVNANEGYMLLANDLGQDSIYKLAKYFLQIQAAVNNEDIIVDPDGALYPGQVHKIPFEVNEADVTIDVIAMVPSPSAVEFYLETPNGQIIKPADSNSIPGVLFSFGANVAYYRLNLPLPLTVPEKEGRWNAILVVGSKYKGHSLSHMTVAFTDAEHTVNRYGVPYSLLVHSYSNLKMNTNIRQSHYEPGTTINISVNLSQYGIPLNTKCSVNAELEMPNNQTRVIDLSGIGNGAYEASVIATVSGVYRFRVKSIGYSLRGVPFTREQVRTVAVWHGGNRPHPESPVPSKEELNKDDLCDLLKCLLSDTNISTEFKAKLEKQGINLGGIIDCLYKYCDKGQRKFNLSPDLLGKLELEYTTLLNTYKDIIERR